MPKPTDSDRKQLLEAIRAEHLDRWDDNAAETMRAFRRVYMVDFWNRAAGGTRATDNATVKIETADGHVMVESYIASLFATAPGVEVGPDATGKGDPEVAEACINYWLRKQAPLVEQASRLALIYPFAAAKLAPVDNDEPLDRVEVRAVSPWEVVVDPDADSWEKQRYLGHRYFLPVLEAKDREGWPKEGYTPRPRERFLQATENQDKRPGEHKLPDDFLFVEIWEVYDVTHDELIFYSPDHEKNLLKVHKPRKLTSEELKAIEEEVDEADRNVGGIPVRSAGDIPITPLAPLYFSAVPDSPLDGMSALGRVYDQLAEKNIYRTQMARASRRDARQYAYKKAAFNEKELAKLTAGVDGALVGLEPEYTGSIDEAIKPLQHGAMSVNIAEYLRLVEDDLQRGQITASFTRGDATKATATEVTALAQYTQSEIGRLASQRDKFLAEVARIYLRMLVLQLEEGDKIEILIDKKPHSVSREDLDADFHIVPLDQAATPISAQLRREQLLRLLDALERLGVPVATLRKELVRSFDLPESFDEDAIKLEKAAAEAPPMPGMPGAGPGGPMPPMPGAGPGPGPMDQQAEVDIGGGVDGVGAPNEMG